MQFGSSIEEIVTDEHGATAHNTPNNDAPSFEKDYSCRSTLLLTVWFASPTAKKLVFHSGGRRII